MITDEDKEALAAEYVLGTLDADERAQAEALMLIDPGLRRDRARLGAPARRAQRPGRAGRAAARLWDRIAGRARRDCAEPDGASARGATAEAATDGASAAGAEVIDAAHRRMQRWRGLHRA